MWFDILIISLDVKNVKSEEREGRGGRDFHFFEKKLGKKLSQINNKTKCLSNTTS